MEQKNTRPRIEESILALLNGERQRIALDFVSYVRSLRMTPQWASVNSWAVSYKGKRVCYIKLVMRQGENAWYIRPAVRYDETLRHFCIEEQIEQQMLDNVHYCIRCGKCAPGITVTFFDRTLEHVCCSPIDFEFHNPGEVELACVKKLIEYRRKCIGCKNQVSPVFSE